MWKEIQNRLVNFFSRTFLKSNIKFFQIIFVKNKISNFN